MDFPENNLPENGNTDNGSTVFSAPQEHTDKKVVSNKKIIIRIIAAFLCVAVLVAGTVAVIKLIPEKEEEEGNVFAAETIFNVDTSEFSKITVVNPKNTLEIYPVIAESKTESGSQVELNWRLEGYDYTLIDQTSLSQIATYASTMNAIRTFESDNGTYGFDNPYITVNVECKNVPSYTITVGLSTADNSGYYIKLSDVDTVYLVNAGDVIGFDVTPLDIAISTAIPAVSEDEVGSGFFEEGKLTSFTSLTVKSKNYANDVVIKPNDNTHFDKTVNYIITSPEYRIADKVDKLLSVFSDGQSVSGCASFDVGEEYLNAFGLNNPDYVLTGKFGDKEYTLKFKEVENMQGNYYCFATGDKLIRIVSLSSAEYLGYAQTDFYQSFMLLESIKDLSGLTVSGNDANHNFGISYDEDNEAYTITADGKTVDAESFKTFYSNLISTTAVDYETNTPSGNYGLTFTLKHTAGGNDTVLSFKQTSEQRYAYFVNGVPLGHITSTAYKNVVSQVNAVAENSTAG